MNENNPIIIEKIPLEALNGGAWKVAYADFVTAMMAFFLLLWLLNVTTDEQKNAISNYFDPTHPSVSEATSGAGGVLGGLTMSPQGSMSQNQNPLIPQQVNKERSRGNDAKSIVKKDSAKEAAEKKRFEEAAEKIKKAIKENKELAALAKNVLVDVTPEGLRIQIVDQENESMFPSSSTAMYKKTETLLREIAKIIISMPNELSVRGHTDAVRYPKGATYTNWELSADRANATRRVVLDAGFPAERLNNVMGKAEMEPLIAENPLDPRNRRLTLILLHEHITKQPDPTEEEDLQDIEDEEMMQEQGMGGAPIGTFRKTPGAVEFP